MAAGATPGQVARLILRDGALLIGVGSAIGLMGFLLAGRLIASIAYGVTVHDLATRIVGSGPLLTAGLAAGLLPAARAGRTDSARVLAPE